MCRVKTARMLERERKLVFSNFLFELFDRFLDRRPSVFVSHSRERDDRKILDETKKSVLVILIPFFCSARELERVWNISLIDIGSLFCLGGHQ